MPLPAAAPPAAVGGAPEPPAPAGPAACAVCGATGVPLVPAALVPAPTAALIAEAHPRWGPGAGICSDDLHRYRMERVRRLVAADRAALPEVEEDLLALIERRQLVAADPEAAFAQTRTLGDRAADAIASFGGSWAFIGLFVGVMAAWVALNAVVLVGRPFDPYPFILLNLVLSCLAALQAPVIMMSQNRQEAHDRVRAVNDYRINLRAEAEVRLLHEKLDHLLVHQWERLLDVQEAQADLLDEIREGR